jgi:elongator complex protein 3
MTSTRRGASHVDLAQHREPLTAILRAAAREPSLTPARLERILKDHPMDGRGLFPRDALVRAYRELAGADGVPPFDPALLDRIRLKPGRTSSGVTPVTVLTKPFPCPGTCIFCPSDVRMPKSYLASEPGAQRAEQNHFDPYLQTFLRLEALRAIGHPTDKVELIILGGTWSFYPEPYQIWFVARVFEALNDFGAGIDRRGEVLDALCEVTAGPERSGGGMAVSGMAEGGQFADGDRDRSYNVAVQDVYAAELRRAREAADAIAAGLRARGPADECATWDELEAAQRANETAACRSVGLSVETRPDHVTPAEIVRIRRLGATKVQIGVQSLDDAILAANRRGHDVAATRRAFGLLRQAGFKIHAHWMLNLHGSTVETDRADYRRLFDDPDFRPDELKIYPCMLVPSAELMQRYQDGSWRPYTRSELVHLLADCLLATPETCRLTRVIRDIPATELAAGEVPTNLRQDVERALAARGLASRDIRAREIRRRRVAPDALLLDEVGYRTSVGDEVFLQLITPDDDRAIAAFLRLTLPDQLGGGDPPLFAELAGAAIIRELHVYGQAVEIGRGAGGQAQHAGLGGRLIERAVAIAAARGYPRLAVISAVGTRAYYRRRRFVDAGLYQVREVLAL